MSPLTTRLVLPLCFLLAVPCARAVEGEGICHQSRAFFAPPDPAGQRQYPPSREIDILHLALEVTPDFMERSVAGKVTLKFKPIARPLQELTLDGIDLTVRSVVATEKILGWQATAKNVIITFDPPVPPDRETSVTINYQARPGKGLYFRTPDMGYKPEDMHVWTQGEPSEARHWYPCYDYPNEKFTSEVTCRVPEGMVVLSNGRLVSEEKDAGSGLVAVRWLQDKPHANYLIALAAGRFKKVEDKYKDIPLAFYTPASQIDQAVNSFTDTKDMMGFFEQEIGVPYPWAKYYQVCVDDFGWGGMENTTLTILHDRTLHTTDTENLRNSQGLVSHELAHQWFGDLVTCKDWAHVWLNEGFATYYAALYDGHKDGPEAMRYTLYESAKQITGIPNQTNAIVRRDFVDPEEQFSFLAYPKGAWVLHMLRSQLGEELYRRSIRTYVERHQFDTAVTSDLSAVIEELSGRSFDQFFDQWVYHAANPELGVNYSWDEKSRLAKISISQDQRLSKDVLLFKFPLTVRFKSRSGAVDREILVKEKAEDFYFPLGEAPDVVRIDPEVTVLAKIRFTPTTAMLRAQLADPTDMAGRLFAVEQFGAKKDMESVSQLKRALNNDPFYGVRLAAAQSLRAMRTDEALEALLASTQQSDARVRRQIVSEIAGFYRESSFTAAQKILASEKNPDIQAVAITALGAYPKPEVHEALLKYLNADSYHSTLADAAIGALRAQADASYVAPLLDALRKNETNFTTGVFSRGLENLAWLTRDEEKKDGVREFLTGNVNCKKRRVQLAAITALGTLGDPKAIAVLETFAHSTAESPERAAAEKSLVNLRDMKRPSAELGTLRGEVLDLQKENRELRRELEELKKKLDAALPSAAGKTKKPVSSPASNKR